MGDVNEKQIFYRRVWAHLFRAARARLALVRDLNLTTSTILGPEPYSPPPSRSRSARPTLHVRPPSQYLSRRAHSARRRRAREGETQRGWGTRGRENVGAVSVLVRAIRRCAASAGGPLHFTPLSFPSPHSFSRARRPQACPCSRTPRLNGMRARGSKSASCACDGGARGSRAWRCLVAGSSTALIESRARIVIWRSVIC